jgi:predicted transcriptional regulator of viral defense system
MRELARRSMGSSPVSPRVGSVKIVPFWKDINIRRNAEENQVVPRSRFAELVSLAEENDGLVTAGHAREAGFTDSVPARLVQRGRIERTSRGVYRVPYFTPGRFSQYREAVLWARANRGPAQVAISHATALAAYEISDATLIRSTSPSRGLHD